MIEASEGALIRIKADGRFALFGGSRHYRLRRLFRYCRVRRRRATSIVFAEASHDSNDQSSHALSIARPRLLCLRCVSYTEARKIEDIDVVGFRLHALQREYAGFHAVWITGNWRIVFRFVDGDAYDLDHLDYH